ncbi:MAG: hypothetical protein AB8B65_11670 [Kordia sp.]|uniref:hypothetical protein n=1 Tax=Kordia sp. TaxID=1965332 RepID=UPI00385AD6A8
MKDFLKKAIEWFSNTKSTPANGKLYPNLPSMKKYFGDALNIKKIDQDAEVSKTLKEFLDTINENGQQFRSIGEDDGTYGIVENSMKDIMRNMASSLRSYVETIFIGLRNNLKTQTESKKEFVKDAKEKHESDAKYLKKLTNLYRWKPKSFSLPIGLLYLAAGITMVLADVYLLVGFVEEIANNYDEALIISTGIGLSTFYIKIFFDQYLFFSIEKSVTRYKKENLPGIKDENEADIKVIKRTYNFRFFFNLSILIICILTFIFLAFFRFETFLIQNSKAASTITQITFIFISLLFPLIGGICAAVGLNKIQNFSILKTAKNQFEENTNELRLLQKELSKLEQLLQNCESYVKWCDINGDFTKNSTDFFYACYLHGYELGFKKQTINMDLFQRAKEMRKQFAARNSLRNAPTLKTFKN